MTTPYSRPKAGEQAAARKLARATRCCWSSIDGHAVELRDPEIQKREKGEGAAVFVATGAHQVEFAEDFPWTMGGSRATRGESQI